MKDTIPVYLVKNETEKNQYKFQVDIGDVHELRVQNGLISKETFLHFINNSKPKLSELYLFLENVEKYELTVLKSILKKPINEFDMSVRLLNGLKGADIGNIEDILSIVESKQELLKFKNFGKKSADELEGLLHLHKLDFKMDPQVILGYKN